jgi:hypothetical protein
LKSASVPRPPSTKGALNPAAGVAMEKGMAAASTLKETSPVIDASVEERIRLFKLDSALGILIIEKKFFFVMVMNILVKIPMNVNTLEFTAFFLGKKRGPGHEIFPLPGKIFFFTSRNSLI